MTGINVRHGIGDLANDLAGIPVGFGARAPRVVRDDAAELTRLARRFAREKSGPHGKAYYKRITMEMTGPFSAEIGPKGIPKSDFVGAGFRHGLNTDLPNAADIVGPKLAGDIGDLADALFHEAGFRG